MFQSNRQLLILSGLLGIVIAIVGQAITLGSPTIDESGGEMATWLADNRALALTGSYLLGLGIALTIPLLVVIYSRLRAAEGGTAMMSATFLLTSLAAIAIVLVALGTFAVGAYRADSVTGDTAGLTRDLAWGILALSAFPAAIAMLAAARLILQTHALPAYIGYLGILGAVLHLASAAAFDTGSGWNLQNGSGVAEISFYLFLVTAGIALLRQREEEFTVVGLAAAAMLSEMGTVVSGAAIVEGTTSAGTARQTN